MKYILTNNIKIKIPLIIVALGLVLFSGTAFAEFSSSANYKIDESFIGNGGLIESNSASYSGNESIGDIGVGESSSANYQTNSSYTTTSDPALTFIVTSPTVNFGAFSTSSAKTATSTFSVINYTSHGYIVQVVGDPPATGAHTLTNLTTQTASSAGTEQFGINLKANTSPTSFGAEASGGEGIAESGYDTADVYKYVAGDTIASAPKSSAQTDFTVSYIVNVSAITPGGTYSGNQEFICVGTY